METRETEGGVPCHGWPTIETPFKWRFCGGPMMAEH